MATQTTPDRPPPQPKPPKAPPKRQDHEGTRKAPRRVDDLILIPAAEYPVEDWPLPTPQQMEQLRDLLPPVASMAQTRAAA
jgi:hypothetical protein